MNVVVINAGVSDPSSTGRLAQQLGDAVIADAAQRGGRASVRVIDLRPLATEIANGLVITLHGPGLQAAVAALRDADAVIAATPVYKAGPSGLLKSFVDLLDDDLLVATPVLLAATAGTARHALVVDEAMRSQFAYLRALTAPTAVFASAEDWGTTELGERIRRAAAELVVLAESGVRGRIRDEGWRRYRHEPGSDPGTELSVAFDSDLMRLATGGTATKPLPARAA